MPIKAAAVVAELKVEAKTAAIVRARCAHHVLLAIASKHEEASAATDGEEGRQSVVGAVAAAVAIGIIRTWRGEEGSNSCCCWWWL
uniref:Uncharacterized protein n=1 Tax=Arundo donax TaxID=35708 RepID=A0A0A9C820_ARUDO